MQTKVSLVMLLMGVALLWLVPLGGALLVVTAALGLAISWESELVADALLPASANPSTDAP